MGRLVEPCLNIVLPELLEVPVGDNIVVIHHFTLFLSLPAPSTNEPYHPKRRATNGNKTQRDAKLHPPPSHDLMQIATSKREWSLDAHKPTHPLRARGEEERFKPALTACFTTRVYRKFIMTSRPIQCPLSQGWSMFMFIWKCGPKRSYDP